MISFSGQKTRKIKQISRKNDHFYVVTSKPEPLLQVAAIDDSRISEEKLAISIGTRLEAEYGLENLITPNIWYRDIITDEIKDFGVTIQSRGSKMPELCKR